MIKEYITKIIDNGNIEDMKKLSNIFDEVIENLKENNPEKYKKYKLEICGIANNYKFTIEEAKEIVKRMKPIGEKWTYEQTSNIRRQYGLNVDITDFYMVMNSMANDYNKIIDTNNVELYTRLSVAFIDDEDSIKNKIWKYYTTIVEE